MKASLALLLIGHVLMINSLPAGLMDEMPKVLKDTLEQSFLCAMQIGPTAGSIPEISGIEQLPEDNEALSKLWGCIWKKKGILDDDAHVDGIKLEEYLVDLTSIAGKPSQTDLEHAHNITEECKTVKASNYGLKAVKIQNCINRYITDRELQE